MTNRIEQNSVRELDYAQNISQGGTSSMTVDSAEQKMGWIRRQKLGVNGGVAKLTANKKIPIDTLGGVTDLGKAITIGPNALAYGETDTNFQITNYDSFTTYQVSTTSGTVSINRDIITYRPQNTTGKQGFYVNGEFFEVYVTARKAIAPSFTFPVDGVSGVQETPTFTVGAFTMDVGTDVHVSTRWEISTSSSFSNLVFSKEGSTDLTSWQIGPFQPNTQYYIRARFTGQKTGVSDWSATTRFSTGVWRPNTPTLVSPTNGTSSVGARVTLVSTPFSIIGGGDTHVATDWWIVEEDNPNVIDFNLISQNNTVDKTTWTSGRLGSNKRYIAKVRHKGALTGWSEWSTLLHFSTVTIMPTTPTITAPPNGAVNIGKSVIINSSNFMNPIDPQDVHESSHWQLSTSPTFDTIYREFANDTNAKYWWNTSDLAPNTHYYVRVRYRSVYYGYTWWSGVVSFTTNSQVPDTPRIIVPTNGETAVGNGVVLQGTDFSMTNGTDTHVASHWQVSTDASFSGMYLETFDDATNTKFWAVSLSFGIKYYVRVRYKGSVYGYSQWSPTISFTVFTPKPAKPSITSPANGATDQKRDVTVTSSSFQSPDAWDMHKSTYWQISLTSDFSQTLESVYVTDPLTQNTFTNLNPNTTYYVRVRHEGMTFGWSDWSNAISFKTKTSFLPTVEVAKLVDPDGSGDFGLSYAFSKNGNAVAVLTGALTGVVRLTIFERVGSSWVVTLNRSFSESGGMGTIDISDNGDVVAFSCFYTVGDGTTGYGVSKIFAKQNGTWVDVKDFPLSRYLKLSGDGKTLIRRWSNGYQPDTTISTLQLKNGTWADGPALTISGQWGHGIGASMDISKYGDTLVVSDRKYGGALPSGYSPGRYFIYKLGANNTWVQNSTVYAQKVDKDPGTASSIDINPSADTLFIREENSTEERLFAYHFDSLNGNTWVNDTVNPIGNDYRTFNSESGVSISYDGTVAAVGSSASDGGKGAVFILTKTGNTWSFNKKLTCSDVSNYYFATSAHLSGDGSMVAAFGRETRAIYIFN